MNEVDKNVLTLLSKALNNEQIEELPHWNETLEELKNHTVFCLPYKNIVESNLLKSEELKEYKRLCFQNIAHSYQLLHAQTQMLELFKNADIPFVILKGAAAAMYYPHPEYRTMGDIDIIVKPEDFNKAYELISRHYVLVYDKQKNYKFKDDLYKNDRHISYKTNENIIIELHSYFTDGKRTKEKNLLDQIIYEGIDQCEYHSINEHTFPCLPPLINGLVLLDHILKHFENGGVGYRQLIDFYECIKHLENVEEFLKYCEKVNLRKFAEVCIQISIDYFGFAYHDLNCNKELEEYIFQTIISDGNFGRKYTDISKAQMVIKLYSQPFHVFKNLQKAGRVHWKASEKYIVLRPFAWIYQIIYYIKQVRNNRGIYTIIDGYKNNKKKNKMIKDLHLK